MSRKVLVKISWSIKQPLEMASFALGTVSAMTDNNEFLSPDIDLISMCNAYQKVQIAYGSRKYGIVAKDELNNTKKELNNYLHKQAEYVNKVANGNSTIIHNAGFESTSEIRGAGTKPNKAGFVKLTAINGGGMKASIAKVNGAINYCFILVSQGEFNINVVGDEILIPLGNVVRIINTTKISVLFKGLIPMEMVRVAVVASNAKGNNGISSVASASTIV